MKLSSGLIIIVASVDEIEEKQKELTELYMSCQQPDTESEAAKGPTIDEVD